MLCRSLGEGFRKCMHFSEAFGRNRQRGIRCRDNPRAVPVMRSMTEVPSI